MTGFHRLEGTLACDGVPLPAIAAAEGTPFYVYSAATIAGRYRAVDEASLASPRHPLRAKANSTLAIARLLRGLGSNADANSGGEIDVALRAGFIPPQIVFTGVGKTWPSWNRRSTWGSARSTPSRTASSNGSTRSPRPRQTRVRVALRVNPDIDARSHPHISTGLKTTKFGIALDEVREIARKAAAARGLELVGLHSHVGSQITDSTPLSRAAEALVTLVARAARRRHRASSISISAAASGISYDGTPAPTATDYAAALLPPSRTRASRSSSSPAAASSGPAAVLVSSVVDVKERPGGMLFVILDAGMTELMRPMLYNAFHRIEPVVRRAGPRSSPTSSARCARQRHARAATAVSPGRRSAICSRSWMPAPMARSWPPTTTAGTMPAEVMVEDGRAHGDPAPADDRRSGGARDEDVSRPRGLLVAFEGLDQSGKQTQAEALVRHFADAGRGCRLLSFPDYATPIGARDRRGLHGERDYGPT